jgi:hypothetical protein
VKAFLMYRTQDFDLEQALLPGDEALIQDLELNTLFNAIAHGDSFLFDVARKAVLSGVSNDLGTIHYRQEILKDCLNDPAVIREIYDIAVESIRREKKIYSGVITYPSSILRRSLEALHMFVAMLKKLRGIADARAGQFRSEGFVRFFTMLDQELSDDYFDTVENHLDNLRFRGGVLVSAELGKGNKGTHYVLRRPDKNQSWTTRFLSAKYSLSVNNHDNVGASTLAELKNRGINLVANALARSADHILSFFTMLRTELAFYIGCLNLHEQLAQRGMSTCFPVPVAPGERRHSFRGLYDVCLALTTKHIIVGNEMQADYKGVVIVTGANQGGKSTFLRSIGLSQLMMQCGMFTPAESFCAAVCDGVFTHFKREEDTAMNSGKLDEELRRLSAIIDRVTPHSLLLFNESLAATNEREGSELAEQIVSALLESHIRIFFVTHLYEFAHSFYDRRLENVMFLRAERQPDGERTFKMIVGEPLQTSYGRDLYGRVFEKAITC